MYGDINMKIKTIQITLDEDTYNQFKRVKRKWKSKNWNDFVDELIARNG